MEIKKENEEKNIIKEELKTTGKKEIEKIDENKKESQEKKNKKEDSGKTYKIKKKKKLKKLMIICHLQVIILGIVQMLILHRILQA